MSNQKEMTKAEIQEALRCLAGFNGEVSQVGCVNCPYIDFCYDLEKVIKQKPKKYL